MAVMVNNKYITLKPLAPSGNNLLTPTQYRVLQRILNKVNGKNLVDETDVFSFVDDNSGIIAEIEYLKNEVSFLRQMLSAKTEVSNEFLCPQTLETVKEDNLPFLQIPQVAENVLTPLSMERMVDDNLSFVDAVSQAVFAAVIQDIQVEIGSIAARMVGSLTAYQPLSSVLTALTQQCVFPLMNYGGYGFNGATRLSNNPLGTSGVDLISDSKQFVLFLDVRFANNASGSERLVDATSSNFFIVRLSTGNFQISAKNSAGTFILSAVTNTAVAALAGRYMIEVSCDLAVGITVKVNGVIQTFGTLTVTNDTIDFTSAQYLIGTNIALNQYFTGDFYRLYLATGTTLDITQDSNSRKFYAPDLTPVFMGWQGELVTGSQPALFLAYDSYTNWFRNRGFAVSTNWTETGTPAAVTTTLNGQYAGGRNDTKTRVITAAGAVYVGIADDTVGINKTVGAATTVNLPKATGTGKRYTIVDVKGDANANNITLTPPSGTINGAATFVMNVNYQSIIVQDMATDVYMVV